MVNFLKICAAVTFIFLYPVFIVKSMVWFFPGIATSFQAILGGIAFFGGVAIIGAVDSRSGGKKMTFGKTSPRLAKAGTNNEDTEAGV